MQGRMGGARRRKDFAFNLGYRLPSDVFISRSAHQCNSSHQLLLTYQRRPGLGTSVAVYGTIPRGSGESIVVDFSVDGGPSQTASREAGRRVVNDELWYQSGTIPNGDHTLTMTYVEGDMNFLLDRIVYNPPPAAPVVTTRATTIVQLQTQTQQSTYVITQTMVSQQIETMTTPPSSSTASAPAGASTSPLNSGGVLSAANSTTDDSPLGFNHTVTATQFIKTSDEQQTADGPFGTGTSTSSAASKGSTPVGAIVGGVIASLICIIFLLLLIFLVRRRRRMRQSHAHLDRQKGLSSAFS